VSTTGSTMRMVRTVGVVLLILGLVALAVGIVYFVVPAHSLPSFMGRTHSPSAHRSKRGTASVVVAVLLLIGAAVAFARSRAYTR